MATKQNISKRKSTPAAAPDAPATPEYLATKDFAALLSDDKVQELEGVAKCFGINRRMIYAVLARSKAQLLERVDNIEESVGAYFEMIKATKNYRQHLSHLVEQADAAEVRVLCVLGTLHERIQGGEA